MHNRLARDMLRLFFQELPAYYVSTSSGNDTTGDGSATTPWATISKALATVPATGNLNIFLDTGTYSENTSASGYLNITQTFSDWVNILPWHPGTAVTITNASGTTYSTRFSNGVKVHFYNVTFEQTGATTKNTVEFTGTTLNQAWFTNCTIKTITYCCSFANQSVSNLIYDNCTLELASGAPGTLNLGFYGVLVTGGSLTVQFNNCSVTAVSNITSAGAIDISLASGTAFPISVVINGGTISCTGGYATQINGGTVYIHDATFTAAGAGVPALVLGQDSAGIVTTSGVVNNCTLTSAASHAFIIGGGCDGVVVSNVTADGGDYSVVFKECANCSMTNSVVASASIASVYFKAAAGSSMTNCQIAAAGTEAILVGDNVGTPSGTLTVTDNTITCTSAANVFNWGDATGDSGGSVCDRNTYDISGTSGNLGSVYGTAGIANLAALQAAWSTYDVTTNDANSTVTS